jgi:predicted GNAT family acetyltransferase
LKETRLTTTTITNNADRSRYEILDAGVVIGQAAYVDDVTGDQVAGQRIFYHTEIDDGYGGRGLAGKLAAQALDETVAADLLIVPVCPFIKKFLGKHPGYAPHVVAPTPAHLEFLRASLSQRVPR